MQHARLSFDIPREVHGSVGNSGTEALKLDNNRPQGKYHRKRFLGHAERFGAYHGENMPRGLPWLNLWRVGDTWVPPDIRGSALLPTVSEKTGIEVPGTLLVGELCEGTARLADGRSKPGKCSWCIEQALMKMARLTRVETCERERD